jgi:hypothetical protein
MSREPINHPPFGRLEWDEDEDAYQGRADLTPKHAVTVRVGGGEDADSTLEEVLAAAASSWEWLRQNEPTARLAVAAEFVDDCNHFFTETGYEEEWDAAGVASHLSLRLVSFETGAVLLEYVDDGEFSGSTFAAVYDLDDREISYVEPWT